jgi:hypothetical protein
MIGATTPGSIREQDGLLAVLLEVEVVVVVEVVAVVGAIVGVGVGVMVGVGVAVGATSQVGPEMVFPSVVSELVRDIILPFTVAPDFKVISRDAIKVPTNMLPDPMVTSRLICQNTLQGCALPVKDTEPEKVKSVLI